MQLTPFPHPQLFPLSLLNLGTLDVRGWTTLLQVVRVVGYPAASLALPLDGSSVPTPVMTTRYHQIPPPRWGEGDWQSQNVSD